MKAKEYFREIAKLESIIRAKTGRAEILRDMAYSIASPKLSDMPKSKTNKNEAPMTKALVKLVDLENEIKTDKQLLDNRKLEALELIGRLKSTDEQTVLVQRYFENKSWREIADYMYYTERWIYKLHGRALLNMEDKIKEFSIVQPSSV